jgi:hypothetical protein
VAAFRGWLPLKFPTEDEVALARAAAKAWRSLSTKGKGHIWSPTPADRQALFMIDERLQNMPSGRLPPLMDAAKPALCRLILTFLRHECTDYDNRIRLANNGDARDAVRVSIMTDLAVMYPFLTSYIDQWLKSA